MRFGGIGLFCDRFSQNLRLRDRIGDRLPHHWVDMVSSVRDCEFAWLAAIRSTPAIMAGDAVDVLFLLGQPHVGSLAAGAPYSANTKALRTQGERAQIVVKLAQLLARVDHAAIAIHDYGIRLPSDAEDRQPIPRIVSAGSQAAIDIS